MSLPTPNRMTGPRVLLGVVLAVFLWGASATLALANPPEPTTGGVRTQVIELAAGWNLVSLSVLPEETAMEAVLAGAIADIDLVKDEDGRHFSPPYGISDIPEWRWDEAYMVRATRPTTVSVTGRVIMPEASPISVSSGWNWVPYLGDQSLPIEEAFASILPSVRQIRDGAGRTYRPNGGNSNLSSVEPGQGYNVHLSATTTLVFPTTTDSGGGDDSGGDDSGGDDSGGDDSGGDDSGGDDSGGGDSSTDFPTLEAALAAVTAGNVGNTLTIGGYYAEGDGGGGTFVVVEDNTLIPNGGTVFAPQSSLGARVTDVRPYQAATYLYVSQPPVNFGSLTMTLSATDAGGNPWSLAIPDAYMHGVASQDSNPWEPAFDHGLGRFRERKQGGWPATQYLPAHLGSSWSVTATFEYTPITGPVRLVRATTEDGTPLAVTTVWSPLWFGCRPHAAAPYFDNAPCLNWTLLAAKKANQAEPGRVTEVRLPDVDGGGELYYYLRGITVPNGVTLSGAAGAEVVEVTDEFGNTYRPVRPRADAVVLKVLPEEAPGCASCASVLNHVLMRRPYSDATHMAPDITTLLGNSWTQIQPEHGATTWGVRNLVIDGNEAGQQAIYNAPYGSSDRETFLRNANSYSGVTQSNHGGKMTEGQNLTVEQTYITGYSATGLITDIYADTTFLRAVAVGDARYNHAAYLLGPIEAEDFSIHGKAWGHVEFYGGRVRNLVVERTVPGRSGAPGIFGFRGGDWDTCEAMASEASRPCGTVIDGFYVDMRGSGRGTPFVGLGPEIEIRNGIVVHDEPMVFQEGGNGYQDARYEGHRTEGFALYRTGGAEKEHLIGRTNLHRGVFRELHIHHDPTPGQRDYGHVSFLRSASNRGTQAPPYETVLDRLGTAETPIHSQFFFRIEPNSETEPNRFFLLNSHHRIDTSTLFRGPNGTGRLASVCGSSEPCAKTDMVQLYLKDTEVQFPSNICEYGNCELFFEGARFDNLTDPVSGLASETRRTYTCQGGETSGYVETGLLWTPHPTRGEAALSGPLASQVVAQEFRTTGGAALGAHDRKNPRWTFTLASPCSAGQQLTVGFKVARWLDENGQPVTVPDWYTPGS